MWRLAYYVYFTRYTCNLSLFLTICCPFISRASSWQAPRSAGYADMATCRSLFISLCAPLPKGVQFLTRVYIRLHTHTHARSQSHAPLPNIVMEVNCSRWPHAPTCLLWTSLSRLCLVLQVFNSQPFYLPSSWPLCQQGCNWKYSYSDLLMWHTWNPKGEKKEIYFYNMRFGSHLSCLKSVTVWQPSAQNSSDSVKISEGQIAVMTLCPLQLKMSPNVIGIKEGSTVSAERQQSGQHVIGHIWHSLFAILFTFNALIIQSSLQGSI